MHDIVSSDRQSVCTTAICTLFEGDYHLGLAAFVNSLVRAGYKGTIWAGFRGELPPWLDQLKRLDGKAGEFMVGSQLRLVFVPLETEIHFTNYKPQFMLDLFADQARGCEYLWYFDPDIFLRCDWTFFANWQRHGIALCEEIVNYRLSERDPLRLTWVEIGAAMGLREPRPLNQYFNGGMVGVGAGHSSFLHLWNRILEQFASMGSDLTKFGPGASRLPYATDQDALNMAAMYTAYPLTTVGPEGMGFRRGEIRMYHAVIQKPWRGSLLLRALAGIPPSDATKFFFTQVSSPIRAYSPWRLRRKRLTCAIAALIGRFYRRQ